MIIKSSIALTLLLIFFFAFLFLILDVIILNKHMNILSKGSAILFLQISFRS